MFITTYNTANPNIKDHYFQALAQPGKVRCHQEFGERGLYDLHRRPSFLKDILVRARIPQPSILQSSHSGAVKNLHNNKTYNVIMNGTCQGNILI